MNIERIEQLHIEMPLKHPFETSFGSVTMVQKIIIAVYTDGLVGYGESPVDEAPLYSYETIETAWHTQRDFLIPALSEADSVTPETYPGLVSFVRGHPMAKAGIEAAIWDLDAKRQSMSLSQRIGGVRDAVRVRVSVGLQESTDALVQRVGSFVDQGYTQIKIKIKPKHDIVLLQALRTAFPDLELMGDANAAYMLDDAEHLKQVDQFDLVMLEQPLAYDDLVDHAQLQQHLETPLCLDESIKSPAQAREMITLGSGKIINIKPARVGGITNAIKIHDMCAESDLAVWCGGLLESGIGRAHNLAMAALPNFVHPGDISGTDRYWDEDIVDHMFTLNDNGMIDVPQGHGIGVSIRHDRLAKTLRRREVYQ